MDLRFKPLQLGEKFQDLDFRENDNSDPMEIDSFFKNKRETYHKNNLSRVWIVREKDTPIAYFTTSMNSIEIDFLNAGEQVSDTTTKRYPAVLIGRMGVDKKYRKKGIGKKVCNFCTGLSAFIGQRIACRYIILETTLNKVAFYEKSGFIKAEKLPRKNKVWMYRKLV